MAPTVRPQEGGLSGITEVGQITDRIDRRWARILFRGKSRVPGRAALAQYSSASITVMPVAISSA
jgi:hypothetical protein